MRYAMPSSAQSFYVQIDTTKNPDPDPDPDPDPNVEPT